MNKVRRRTLRFTLISLVIISVLLLVLLLTSDRNPVKACRNYPLSECPDKCVICPPCEVCSSLVCQSEEFCEDLGFNKSWLKGTGYSEEVLTDK